MKKLFESWRHHLKEETTKSSTNKKDYRSLKAVDSQHNPQEWVKVPQSYKPESLEMRYLRAMTLDFMLWAKQDPRVSNVINLKNKKIRDLFDGSSLKRAASKYFDFKAQASLDTFKGKNLFSLPPEKLSLAKEINNDNSDLSESILLYFIAQEQFFVRAISLIEGIKTTGEDICFEEKEIKGREIASLWKGGCMKDYELKKILLKELRDLQFGVEKYSRFPKLYLKDEEIETGVFGLPALK